MSQIARWWRNLSVGSRLASLISLLVMVAVLTLTTLTVQRERVNFRNALEVQVELLLETLPVTMRDSLYRFELDDLRYIGHAVSDNEELTLFIVYDERGVVLVDARETAPIFSQEVDPLGAYLVTLPPGEVYLDWQDTQLVAGSSIAVGNQTLGAITLGLSTAPLQAEIAALTRQSILLALAIVGMGWLMAFLLARQLTTPLKALIHVAARMTGGALDTRVAVHATDEIGQLGMAFNHMAEAIQRRENDLRELAAGLEQTVAARTAELRARNAALEVAQRQAEEANQAKSEVLAVVSHEMRTPLTSILGFARLIGRRLDNIDCDDPEVQLRERAVARVTDNVNIIISEGERLITMINEMLDLSKIESGKAAWQMESMDVADIIAQSATATAGLFETKPVTLQVDAASDLPPVQGDRDRLIQVLVNLLSNAIKFTEAGQITCRAHLDEDAQIVVSVADTGSGIHPEDYERVFEPFVQVGEQPSGGMAGTGLGLPICRQIVEHHGGRIWVESVLGEGSTFYFTLPV